MNLTVDIYGLTWRITNQSGLFRWPPLLAAATTIGSTTVFDSGLCPDQISLAHEWYHVSHTSWLRYLWSFTVGRIWSDQYWVIEERTANAYGAAHTNDPQFLRVAAQVRSIVPVNIPLVTITHTI